MSENHLSSFGDLSVGHSKLEMAKMADSGSNKKMEMLWPACTEMRCQGVGGLAAPSIGQSTGLGAGDDEVGLALHNRCRPAGAGSGKDAGCGGGD